MDFLNPFALSPELLPVKVSKPRPEVSFQQACETYRDAKAHGFAVPNEVMGAIATHAAEQGTEVPEVLDGISEIDPSQSDL